MAVKEIVFSALAGGAGGAIGTKVSEVFVQTVPDLGDRAAYALVGFFALATILAIYGAAKSKFLSDKLMEASQKK